MEDIAATIAWLAARDPGEASAVTWDLMQAQPVTLALPYLGGRALKRVMAASLLVLALATLLSMRDQPYRHLLPDWLASYVMAGFAPEMPSFIPRIRSEVSTSRDWPFSLLPRSSPIA